MGGKRLVARRGSYDTITDRSETLWPNIASLMVLGSLQGYSVQPELCETTAPFSVLPHLRAAFLHITAYVRTSSRKQKQNSARREL